MFKYAGALQVTTSIQHTERAVGDTKQGPAQQHRTQAADESSPQSGSPGAAPKQARRGFDWHSAFSRLCRGLAQTMNDIVVRNSLRIQNFLSRTTRQLTDRGRKYK